MVIASSSLLRGVSIFLMPANSKAVYLLLRAGWTSNADINLPRQLIADITSEWLDSGRTVPGPYWEVVCDILSWIMSAAWWLGRWSHHINWLLSWMSGMGTRFQFHHHSCGITYLIKSDRYFISSTSKSRFWNSRLTTCCALGCELVQHMLIRY